jgi:hypothetical protein
MAIALSSPPGFAAIPDTALDQDQPARGLLVSRIAENGAFAKNRIEIFDEFYHDGDTVPLPSSPFDHYNYSRNELNYFWSVHNTANPSTNWASAGAGNSLYLMNWKVDQATGLVTSEEYYRTSDNNLQNNGATKDGTLRVFTIGQRQKDVLVLPTPPSYVDHQDCDFYNDEALKTGLLKDIAHNSFFATVAKEVFYMGEFVNGDQVPTPSSSVDGYAYSYGECKFLACWRWTTTQNAFVLPDLSLKQIQSFNAIVDASGNVAVDVWWKTDAVDPVQRTDYGRIAVFAFCRRTTPSVTQGPFVWQPIDPNLFNPGSPLPSSVMVKINRNIKNAVLSPEFFGSVRYVNGDQVALPASPNDSFAYARHNLQYLYDFGSTSLPSPPFDTDIRIVLLFSYIDDVGNLNVSDFRLQDGGSILLTHDGQLATMVVANRD